MVAEKEKSFKMVDESPKATQKNEKSHKMAEFVSPFIAKKDHRIVHNEVDLTFVKGKRYVDIPIRWEPTLKAENII